MPFDHVLQVRIDRIAFLNVLLSPDIHQKVIYLLQY